MGRSVLLAPASSSVHMRVIRDELGRGIKLEGPFSDKGGAVAEIADHVRVTHRRSGGSDLIETTILTLLPQNLLLRNYLQSNLKIPFVLSEEAPEYPESAGAVTSARTVGFRNGEARPANMAALTMLAVSVLRKLDVECYFSLYNFGADPFYEMLSNIGIGFVGQTVPVIISPADPYPIVAALIPCPLNLFLGSPPEAFEVLDGDALLSLIKLQNAYKHAERLMADIANRTPKSEEERTVSSMRRSIQIGHMVSEGMSLWTPAQAVESGNFFGSDGLVSVRLEAEKSIVHTITCRTCHTETAISMMLEPDTSQALADLAGEGDNAMDFIEFLETVPDTSAIRPLREYLESASMMNEHIHAASECKTCKEAN